MKRRMLVLRRFINAATFSRAKAPDGSAQHIMVTKVEGDNVMIDINHPLVGVALNFDAKIENLRDATKEELEHGHSHEGDGHSH